MTELNKEQEELNALKDRAKLMGISFHPSIGLEALRAKVNGSLEESPVVESANQKPSVVKAETENQRRTRKRKEASQLVRVSLSCVNPAKKEWPGEIISGGNAEVGFQSKFVPFNAQDVGYHIPRILLNVLKERKCTIYVNKTLENGMKSRQQKLIKEFNIEELPPLTENELKELARVQAAKEGKLV